MSSLGQIPPLPPSTDYDRESSASSGQKRRRDGSPSYATSFLQTARKLVEQRTNINICWNCHAPLTELCHVIAKSEPAYAAMLKKGMVTFCGLGDYRNAIPLCGSCHNWFDRTSNTGWVFLPSDLNWFIEWEETDFADRTRIFEETGRQTERTYPNEKDYETHMRKTGLLTDPDDGLCRGGFYNSYILEDMFAPCMMEALRNQGMTVPSILPGDRKRWHGAPMAAINRGFVVTGAPEMKLPEKEWDLLRTLQRLYSRKLQVLTECEARTVGMLQEGTTPRVLHDTITARGQQGNENQTTRPATLPGPQNETPNGPGDALSPVDSAIDIYSQQERQTKRKHELGIDEASWFFGPYTTTAAVIDIYTGKRRRTASSVLLVE